MVSKKMRTKEKYAKAAAEMDILQKSLFYASNLTDLLPAKEIDYLIKVHYKIAYLKIFNAQR